MCTPAAKATCSKAAVTSATVVETGFAHQCYAEIIAAVHAAEKRGRLMREHRRRQQTHNFTAHLAHPSSFLATAQNNDS